MSAIADDIPRGSWWPEIRLWLIGLLMGLMIVVRYTGDPGTEAACTDSVWSHAGTFWPDESCTGWEHTGVTLTAYTGSMTLNAGTTIDSKLINGCLEIAGANVTIKRSKIVCPNDGDAIFSVGGHANLLVEDVEIQCGGANGSTGFGGYNVTLRRVNAYGCENIVFITTEGNVLIEWSYLHDPIPYDSVTDPHTDAIQNNGDNVTVFHSVILGGGPNQFDEWGSSAMSTNFGNQNVVVQENIFAGGVGSLLFDDQNVGGMQADIIDNRFSTIYGPNVGEAGPLGIGAGPGNDFTVSGNVCHETNNALSNCGG